MPCMQFGKDGFSGQKENGAVCGLRRLDVARGDVLDVLLQIGTEVSRSLGVVRILQQGAIAFQGKFGIDADVAAIAWQKNAAVGALAVVERVLVAHVLCGQDVVDQGLELDFAESTTAALVGKDVLQAADAAREMVKALLRFIYGGKAGDDAFEGVLGVVLRVLQALLGLAGEAGKAVVQFIAQQGILLLLLRIQAVLLAVQGIESKLAQLAELALLVRGKLLQLPKLLPVLAMQVQEKQQAGQ